MLEKTNLTENKDFFDEGFSERDSLTASPADTIAEEGGFDEDAFIPDELSENYELPPELFAAEDADIKENLFNGEEAAGEALFEEVDFYQGKYNGEAFKIPKRAVEAGAEALGVSAEEYIATIQKGMNYDHLCESTVKLSDYKMLAEMAADEGLPVEKYIHHIAGEREERELNKSLGLLRTKFPQADEALLYELASARNRERLSLAKGLAAAENPADRAWKRFFAEYPQMSPDRIPKDVLKSVAEGNDPLALMKEHELRHLRRCLTQVEWDERVRNKSLPDMSGTGGDVGDDFLKGFFGS